jgi:hypothetical protein
MLPMMVTVNLAKGALTMAGKKVIVKRLPAIQSQLVLLGYIAFTRSSIRCPCGGARSALWRSASTGCSAGRRSAVPGT